MTVAAIHIRSIAVFKPEKDKPIGLDYPAPIYYSDMNFARRQAFYCDYPA